MSCKLKLPTNWVVFQHAKKIFFKPSFLWSCVWFWFLFLVLFVFWKEARKAIFLQFQKFSFLFPRKPFLQNPSFLIVSLVFSVVSSSFPLSKYIFAFSSFSSTPCEKTFWFYLAVFLCPLSFLFFAS